MISWLDIVVVLLAARGRSPLGAAVRPPPASGRSLAAAAVVASVLVAARSRCAPAAANAAGRPDPLFAYYYIWFNADSWNRAKIDYPLLGRYSSDERGVMRQHIELGQAGGHRRVHRQLEEHAGPRPAAATGSIEVAERSTSSWR